MKKYVLIFLLFIFSTSYSQSNFEWKTYFGGNYDAGSDPVDCLLDDNGNLYLMGYEVGPVNTETSLLNIFTIKVSPSGEILWKKSYGRSGYYEDTPYSICLDNSGNVFVLGTTPDSAAQTRLGVIIKYSNDGNFIWDKKFNMGYSGANLSKILYLESKLYLSVNYTEYTPNTSHQIGKLYIFSSITGDSLSSIQSSPDILAISDFCFDKKGNLYINWVKETWPTDYRNSLSKYDRNLNLKWNTALDTTTAYLSYSVDDNLNVYLSGSRGIYLGGSMINTVKIDSTGNFLWMREYIGSINNSYAVKNIVDSENNLYVLGASRTSNLSDSNNYALIKYSQSGDSVWVRKELTSLNEYYGYPRPIMDFGIDSQNNIFVFANIYPTPALNERFRITKYSASGNLLKRVYNNNYLNNYDVINFKVDKNGFCYLTGTYIPSSNSREHTYIAKISGTVGINNQAGSYVSDFSLSQNYPNPFNPSTRIQFYVPKAGTVKIIVYDITGRIITELADKYFPAGEHNVNFDAGSLSGGVYFYKALYENYSETKKMVLIK